MPLPFFAFLRRALAPLCFAPPLPRRAMPFLTLAARYISAPQLCISVHFRCGESQYLATLCSALAMRIIAFPLRFLAFLGVSLPLRCVAIPCVTTPSPVHALLCNAFALLMISYDFVAIPLLICALHRLRRSQLYFAAACRRNTMQRLCTAQLSYAMPIPRGCGCHIFSASVYA